LNSVKHKETIAVFMRGSMKTVEALPNPDAEKMYQLTTGDKQASGNRGKMGVFKVILYDSRK